MFILLIMDVVLIWLTIRSKSSAARASGGQQQPRVSAGEPAYAHRANSDVQLDSVNHENPFADEMGPYIPDSHYTAGLQNPRAPEPILGPNGAYPALSTYGEPARSHLNTPITQ